MNLGVPGSDIIKSFYVTQLEKYDNIMQNNSLFWFNFITRRMHTPFRRPQFGAVISNRKTFTFSMDAGTMWAMRATVPTGKFP